VQRFTKRLEGKISVGLLFITTGLSQNMGNNKSSYDYGKCHVCGKQMKEERITQHFWLKGKLIVIESVPAGVCPQCGEKTVKSDVGRQLATLIQNLKSLPKRKTITVQVVRYAKEVA
jgi:YgiT-type zinc finger domain-containing protein